MYVPQRINQKLLMHHEVQVQQNLVHKMLQNEYPGGLQFCCPSSKNMEKKRLFSCDGRLDVVSRDGREKLCGYQNWTLCVSTGCVWMSRHFSEKDLIFVHLLLDFKFCLLEENI